MERELKQKQVDAFSEKIENIDELSQQIEKQLKILE